MSRHFGILKSYEKLTKHSDMCIEETGEEFDYINNERRFRETLEKKTNSQTGTDSTFGLGYLTKPRPALSEGNKSTAVALFDYDHDDGLQLFGLKHGGREVTPKKGEEEEMSDEEVTECPPDPNRPGLKYKRTRRRKITLKQGDSKSQTTLAFGIGW